MCLSEETTLEGTETSKGVSVYLDGIETPMSNQDLERLLAMAMNGLIKEYVDKTWGQSENQKTRIEITDLTNNGQEEAV